MDAIKIKEIIELHRIWLNNDEKGVMADLSGADLSGADLPSKFYSVSQIGSRKGMTTYSVKDDKIWCGCFTGTLSEFETRVKETHKDNQQYLREYTAAIEFFKTVSKE